MKKLILAAIVLLTFSTTKAQAEPVIVLDSGYEIGSGTVIDYQNGVSIILTARHVCQGNSSPGVMLPTKSAHHAAVIALHIKEDLCLMMTLEKYEVTKVAKSFDFTTEEAFELSLFPGPLAGIKMKIEPLGAVFDPYFGHYMPFNGIAYPGMSGSPILNKNNELIGVLIVGTIDSLHGGYVELPYIYQLLNGVDSAVVNVYRTQAHN